MDKKRQILINYIKSAILIVLGVLSAGFGLESFLIPNGFIDGGVTGISLLVKHLTGWHLSILLLVINLPFMLLGFKHVGKGFAISAIFSIIGLAIVVGFVKYPIITSDKLLIAVFGGFFLGAGIGLSIRGGSVLDGTEILAIYLSKKTGFTIGDIILAFNILIFGVAAYFLSMEVAMYSILTYLSASKTVDFFVEGIDEYVGVTIISIKSNEIRKAILIKLKRGVTIYNGKSGMNKNELEIIYTVVSRLELAKLKDEVELIDENAFMVMSNIKDTKGGVIKKRNIK